MYNGFVFCVVVVVKRKKFFLQIKDNMMANGFGLICMIFFL
jgi:hypothetical protein